MYKPVESIEVHIWNKRVGALRMDPKLGYYVFSYDKAFQLSVATALAISYFAWGVIHHMIHKDLHISVVIEYAMISILGLTVVISVIFGS